MKTSRQEGSAVAWSYSSAPGTAYVSGSVALMFGIKKTMLGESNILPFSGFLQSGRHEESSFEYSRLDDRK